MFWNNLTHSWKTAQFFFFHPEKTFAPLHDSNNNVLEAQRGALQFDTVLICLLGHWEKKGLVVEQAAIWTMQDATSKTPIKQHSYCNRLVKPGSKIKSDWTELPVDYTHGESNSKRH